MKLQKLDFNIFHFFKNIGIAALLFGAAIFFYACENNIEKIKAFSTTDNLPILEAIDFETLFTDSGQVRYLLKTPRLLRFENDGKEFHEFPEGVEIVQYDANGEIVSTLKANYAQQFLKEDKWEAKNNVIVTNEKGDTLKTEHLIWEKKTEEIYTEEFVEIIRTDGIYTGIGLTADETMQSWRINKLKGIIYFETEDKKAKKPASVNMEPNIKEKKNKPFESPVILK